MATLYQLKNELANTKSYQDLANIMKMVATRKFPDARDRWEAICEYETRMNDILRALLTSEEEHHSVDEIVVDNALQVKGESHKPFVFPLDERFASLKSRLRSLDTQNVDPLLIEHGKDGTRNQVIIVISSNQGYCGGFNREVKERTDFLLRDCRRDTVKLICIGKKCAAYFRNYQASFKEWLEREFPEDSAQKDSLVKEIVNDVISCYVEEERKFGGVAVVYNKFIELQDEQYKVEVTAEKLLPLQSAFGKQSGQVPTSIHLFEPALPIIRSLLATEYLYTHLMRILYESESAEHYSRMKAMSEASENISEKIQELQLSISKTRQAAITRELVEIISGAEAFKKTAEE